MSVDLTNLAMTFIFAFSCVLTAFTPASAIFLQIVAKDPLRVILCALGAFFWLVALMVSSLLWLILANSLLPTIVVSALLQELARCVYYFLLHRAQGGLVKLTSAGVGVSGLHSSRHVLAVVCGLGMGVMAAICLLLNIIVDSSGDGVVGLPASIPEIANKMPLQLGFEDAGFPIYYSLSCCFLILNNICWTIAMWDGLHKRINRLTRMWWQSAAFAVVSHLVNSVATYFLSDLSAVVVCVQAAMFTLNAGFCAALVQNRILASNAAAIASVGGAH